MKKIYIAGQVTGLPYSTAYNNFELAENQLLLAGYEPVNPTKYVRNKTNWLESMKICIKLLLDCESIYLLKNWKYSKGARIEYRIAKELGYNIVSQIDGIYDKRCIT